MAIVLTVGVNSWVTLAESNAWFEARWNSSATWAALSDDQKKQLLITAFRWIFYTSRFDIPASSTQENVKVAQMELAWWIYNYFDENEDRRALYDQGVRDFKLSKWEEELDKAGFPSSIEDILADELINIGGVFPTVSRNFNNNSS